MRRQRQSNEKHKNHTQCSYDRRAHRTHKGADKRNRKLIKKKGDYIRTIEKKAIDTSI